MAVHTANHPPVAMNATTLPIRDMALREIVRAMQTAAITSMVYPNTWPLDSVVTTILSGFKCRTGAIHVPSLAEAQNRRTTTTIKGRYARTSTPTDTNHCLMALRRSFPFTNQSKVCDARTNNPK